MILNNIDTLDIEQFSVMVPGGGHSNGCHGYCLPCARALPGCTNSQAHHQLPNSFITDTALLVLKFAILVRQCSCRVLLSGFKQENMKKQH